VIREQKKGPAVRRAFTPWRAARDPDRGRLIAEVVKWLFGTSALHRATSTRSGRTVCAGFVTSADMAGATTAQIMDVTGHRDPKSLRRYTGRGVAAQSRSVQALLAQTS
jgi:hypothetical protein